MNNKEKEIREKEEFNNVINKMSNEGYERKDHIISPLNANIFGILTPLPFMIIPIVYYILNYKNFDNSFQFTPVNFIIILIVSLLIHEFIHGFTWSFYCKDKFKSIKFGFNLSGLMPYAHCREALSKNGYMIGVLMPFVILGIIPMLLMFIFPTRFLFLFSILNMLFSGGDLLIAFHLLKYKDIKVFDHPTDPGFVAFEKK